MSQRLALFLVVALAACRSAGPAAAPKAPPSPPPAPAANATPAATAPAAAPFRAPEAIRWVRDSAEHRAIFIQIYRAATEQVEREAAGRAPGTWAVILDADETVIDNSLYQLERAKLGLGFDRMSWHAWTKRREAGAQPGAHDFLARVHALGGKIAIVTNRAQSECPDTQAVFQAHDLAYDVILCMPDGGPSDKNPRFAAVALGETAAGHEPLEILAFLGDNIRDFPSLSQALKDKDDAAFAEFGDRYFVLPNPMYGSWN
jgi:5'-nucleotidase (lipoprotein e(P4) family)